MKATASAPNAFQVQFRKEHEIPLNCNLDNLIRTLATPAQLEHFHIHDHVSTLAYPLLLFLFLFFFFYFVNE